MGSFNNFYYKQEKQTPYVDFLSTLILVLKSLHQKFLKLMSGLCLFLIAQIMT